MNLFNTLLDEAVKAEVYRNTDNTLTVISNLVKKKFSTNKVSGNYSGACLLLQVFYSISSVTKIPVNDLLKGFTDKFSVRGITFEHIFKHFNDTTVNSKGKKYKIKLSLEEYKTISDVVNEISKGQPVVMIVNAYGKIASSIAYTDSEGKVDNFDDPSLESYIKASKKKNTIPYFHALLLIGYDHPEDQLIGRETDEGYGLKGYFKLNGKKLQSVINAVKLFGVTVDSCTEVK